MSDLVLVTGGTGKTGRRVVAQLNDAGVSCRVASRSQATPDAVAFDWSRPDTWDQALEGVTSAYLVPPASGDAAVTMIDFIKAAIDGGTSRFVLLSASPIPAGGPAAGQVHQWLQQHADDWAVLRPTWFMQNLSEGRHHATIRDENTIYSATEDGRIPFISADDIASTALAALTGPNAVNEDYVLTSRKPVSYDEVAEIISRAMSRTITHRRISAEQLQERFLTRGLPMSVAQMLASMDSAIASGSEDRVTDCVETLTGRQPITINDFVHDNTAAWSNDR